MNSFIKYIPESLNDHKAFVELLLSIIDTKLQFTKHRTNVLISSYANSPIIIVECNTVSLENVSLDIQNSPLESEKIFILIEECSKATNLLLLMRSKLAEKNVSLIYDLLNNDRYLNYEGECLRQLLEKSLF